MARILHSFWYLFPIRGFDECSPNKTFIAPIVPGSSSWRIPLAVQLIPGILLGIGSLRLPPSPRLLILKGDYTAGEEALKRLRMEDKDDTEDEVLERLVRVRCSFAAFYKWRLTLVFKLESFEIQAEAQLIHEVASMDGILGKSTLESEVSQWKLLFNNRYIARVMVGVVVMVFQRECL